MGEAVPMYQLSQKWNPNQFHQHNPHKPQPQLVQIQPVQPKILTNWSSWRFRTNPKIHLLRPHPNDGVFEITMGQTAGSSCGRTLIAMLYKAYHACGVEQICYAPNQIFQLRLNYFDVRQHPSGKK